ncbi:MAG: hypothetical protein GYB31_06575 [Bacteroidetes bacterium]|nr:hypothetical protein [Bacteroidota bacterium]
MKIISHRDMQQFVDKINEQLPVHAMWDGYQIRKFKRKNLVIGGSQDWIYYHNVDLIFKQVTFFNLPARWRDTQIVGEDLFRLSDKEEFAQHHPDFVVGDKHVFAIDLHFSYQDIFQKHTYFVVASRVFFERLKDPSGDGLVEYEDPLGEVGFLPKTNRLDNF